MARRFTIVSNSHKTRLLPSLAGVFVFILVFAPLFFPQGGRIFAAESTAAETTDTLNDSLDAEAAQPDFIRVGLLTIGPGAEVYSLYGHTALRLECPSKQLDYCFAFEMPITPGQELRFLFTTAKAGFMVRPTTQFIDKYRIEGRSIDEMTLNLRPHEEQELWRLLDEELEKGAHWDYDFLTRHCSAMCVWAVEQALLTGGEQIDYDEKSRFGQVTYSQLLDSISAGSPWARLFWQLRMAGRGGDCGQQEDLLAPKLLANAWQHATIADADGHRRPMMAGNMRHHCPQTLDVSRPSAVTPAMALGILSLVILAVVVFCLYRRKHRNKNA
jgi:hypothetical protein